MNDYCLKMKSFTDSLIDLGVDVPNRVLVLNVLHRLNKAFNHLHAHNTFSFFPPTVLLLHALTTLALGPSSSPTACSCRCRVPTPLRKMVKLSASSVPLTM
jgi:hypothetical protein